MLLSIKCTYSSTRNMKIFFVVRPSVPTYDPSRNFLTAPRHVYMFFAALIFVCLSIDRIRYLHWSPPSFWLLQLCVSCLHWSRSTMLFDCRQRRRGEIIISADTSAVPYFLKVPQFLRRHYWASFPFFCIKLHRWEKVSSSWTTVRSIELAAQPLFTSNGT